MSYIDIPICKLEDEWPSRERWVEALVGALAYPALERTSPKRRTSPLRAAELEKSVQVVLSYPQSEDNASDAVFFPSTVHLQPGGNTRLESSDV